MHTATSTHAMRDVPHEHAGDLHRPDEEPADTAVRIRAHLRQALPDMDIKARRLRGAGSFHLRFSITRHAATDLSDSATRLPAWRLVDVELERFIRYDWDPHHGIRNPSLTADTSIDPAFHAAATDGGPELSP